jgi:hypothetical protein
MPTSSLLLPRPDKAGCRRALPTPFGHQDQIDRWRAVLEEPRTIADVPKQSSIQRERSEMWPVCRA